MFFSIPRVCPITFCDPRKNVLLDSISLIFPLPNLAASSSNSIYCCVLFFFFPFFLFFFPLIFDEVRPEHPGFLVSKNADGSEVEGEKGREGCSILRVIFSLAMTVLCRRCCSAQYLCHQWAPVCQHG